MNFLKLFDKFVRFAVIVTEALAKAGLLPKENKKQYVIDYIIEKSNEIPVIEKIPDNILRAIISTAIDLTVMYYNTKYGKDWIDKISAEE